MISYVDNESLKCPLFQNRMKIKNVEVKQKFQLIEYYLTK